MAYKQLRPIIVSEGGTGNTTLTVHTVLLGNSTSAITQLANGTTGQVLKASTGIDPLWGQVTLTTDVTGTLPVANGGTNNTTFTAYALLTAGTTATGAFQNVSGTGTAGQILVSAGASALPVWTTAGGGFTWAVTTVDASIVVENGYIANKAALLTLTLPSTAVVGDAFIITNINTAVGFRIAQNALQQIRIGTSTTTIGVTGYLEATALGDTVECVCTTAGTSTRWQVIDVIGNVTVV